MRRTLVSPLAGLLLTLTVPAFAAVSEISPPAGVRTAFAKTPELLAGAHYFAGPGNLTGVVTKGKDGKPAVFYVSPDGVYVVIGLAMDVATGRNLTAEAVVQFFPNSTLGQAGQQLLNATAVPPAPKAGPGDPVPAAGVTPASFDKLAYIETGAGPSVIYALVDPQCKHCQNAHQQIVEWQQKGGRTRVRWIPVSLGNEVSSLRAAQALAEGSPAALSAMFKEGAAAMPKDKVTKGATLLTANMQFIETSLPITATPVFIFPDGGKVVAKTGFGGIAGLSLK